MADRGPSNEEAAAFRKALSDEARYGGATDATSGLAALTKAFGLMGPVNTAVTTLGSQKWGGPTPGTETMGVGKFVGIPRAQNKTENLELHPLAQMFGVGRPGKGAEMPAHLRELFARVPEHELVAYIRANWKPLGSGAFRDAYVNKGVVAKIAKKGGSIIRPDSGEMAQAQNAQEFLTMIKHKAQGKRGAEVRVAEPLAYSTKSGVVFSRLEKPKYPRGGTFDERDQVLAERAQAQKLVNNFAVDHNINDVRGGNWMQSPGNRSVIYDAGITYPSPQVPKTLLSEIEKDSPQLFDSLSPRPRYGKVLGETLSPAAQRLIQAFGSIPKTKIAGQ